MSEIGINGQRLLLSSKVLCIGAGGIGSTTLIYLASSGIGTIGIVEIDVVEISNLHRQPLYNIYDIGKEKLERAYFFLKKINPDLNVIKFKDKFSRVNAYNIMKQFEVVIDCTDNFESKFLINAFAYKLKIPMIYGAALHFDGQIAVFDSFFGACLKCLYFNYPLFGIKNCSEDGVIGPMPGLIGCLQSLECIKLILYKNNIGNFNVLLNKILFINGIDLDIKVYQIKKNINCDICSNLSNNILNESSKNIFYNNIKLNYKKIYLFDIREVYKYNNNHLIGSINIPLHIFDLFIPLLYKKLSYHDIIIIYCDINVKSLIIYKLLKKYLYFNVYSLQKAYDQI